MIIAVDQPVMTKNPLVPVSGMSESRRDGETCTSYISLIGTSAEVPDCLHVKVVRFEGLILEEKLCFFFL